MKKVLSLLLAVMLVVGLAPVVFAATGYQLGTSASNAFSAGAGVAIVDTTVPGTTFPVYLANSTGGFINKSTVKTDKLTFKVTTPSGKKALSGSQTTSIKYDAAGNAYVEVKFAKPFVSTSSLDYEIEVQLFQDKVKVDTFEVSGTLGNAGVEVQGGDEYVSLVNGTQFADVKGYCKNLEMELQEDFFVYFNAFNGKKYYGYISKDIKDADQEISAQYPDIEYIYYLSQVNLAGSGTTVKINGEDSKMFVYNADLEYLGTTDDKLPISEKYYVSTKELDIESDVDEAPTGDDATDAGNPDMGGDDVPANINDNPGTGR